MLDSGKFTDDGVGKKVLSSDGAVIILLPEPAM